MRFRPYKMTVWYESQVCWYWRESEKLPIMNYNFGMIYVIHSLFDNWPIIKFISNWEIFNHLKISFFNDTFKVQRMTEKSSLMCCSDATLWLQTTYFNQQVWPWATTTCPANLREQMPGIIIRVRQKAPTKFLNIAK